MKETDTISIVLIQHELLMAIGQSLELKDMLDNFACKSIKTLNTPSIHIILKRNKDFSSDNQVLSYPKLSHSDYHVLDDSFMSIPEKTDLADCVSANKMHSYMYSIKNIGYIIFERYQNKLDDNVAQALIPIVKRLGDAVFTCYQHKQIITNSQKYELAELKLRLEKSKLQTTLNAISNGVVTLNRELEILYMNPTAQKFLGVSKEEFKGQRVLDNVKFFDTEDQKDITNIFFEYLEIKGSWKNIMPLILETISGTRLTVEINAKGVINNSGDISSYVVVVQDVTHTLAIENELKWQATHDPLTHLLNRRGFEAHLQRVIYQNNTSSHVLLYLDLDRFKIINDVCGHHAGDVLLKQISELIRNEIRVIDTFSRLGGDEFGIILHDTELDIAMKLAHRIKQSVAKFRFAWEKNLFNIGVSIGVTLIDKLTTDMEAIMYQADTACFTAKENGRNQVYLADYDNNTSNQPKTNTNFVSLVNSAIEENRLELYGQIIVPISSKSKDKAHIELLLRMRDKESDKIIPPDAFLPIAERYGKIRDIDLWVVQQAFNYLKQNQDYEINVNLSGVTLSDKTVLKEIIDIVKNNKSYADRICFEITETAIITSLDRCIRFINNVKELGCSFALDDFGSGLSSFSYLKNLPVKYLKIDGSFIKDFCSNKTDEIVVSSIHQTAKALSIKTVAEYVSNDEIYDAVKKIGIDFAQGYQIRKPCPLSEIQAVV